MLDLYAIAAIYILTGIIYAVMARNYLTVSKWRAVLTIYFLTVIAVLVQLVKPFYLVEMFSTAMGLLVIMLIVIRPEETLDSSVNISSWKAYQEDLKNILRSGQEVQIVVARMSNAEEIRAYLGEDEYNRYVRDVADEIRKMYDGIHAHFDLYFEKPGTYYHILEDTDVHVPDLLPVFVEAATERIRRYAVQGVRFVPQFCMIHCPRDLRDLQDIINLGHKFYTLGAHGQTIFMAPDLIGTRMYDITNRMDGILNRAITGNTLEVYYQPIYDVYNGKYRSAEALARVNDTMYGMISPSVFIPAAESSGLILPLGDMIMEKVFAFIANHDLEKLGLSYIEINLSVAQCVQQDLPEKISRLQKKYNIRPDQVNFEVTETMFENFSTTMDNNIHKLKELGYTFSLDDYGVGYSNIQRMCKLPVDIVKIDKSLVDGMFTEEGSIIIKSTINMMQGIQKELVIEGVETKEAADELANMSCNCIQGFYYSRPLQQDAFLQFVEAQASPQPA